MAKLHRVYLAAAMILGCALTCVSATTYVVGDTAGWDISSDLDTWPMGKTFQVGDVLVFQYASSDAVSEVANESYDKCNTTNVLRTYSSGNTTVTLDKPGAWYFISGNRMYCLGGMKLALYVQGQAISPAGAPRSSLTAGAPGSQPRPSSKSGNPSLILPSSAERNAFAFSFLCLVMGTLILYVLLS